MSSETLPAAVQARVRAFAARLGFDTQREWEIAIAASEAVTNAIKYAGAGVLSLRALPLERPGMEFVMVDHGGGIVDVAGASRDGVSEGLDVATMLPLKTRGGLGIGLGAIQRLMDEVQIQTTPGSGCTVVAKKYLSSSGAKGREGEGRR